MDIDLDTAALFMTTHARLVDRRRMDVLLARRPAAEVLLALDAYRNPDGGYGWALEPDHRSATSQPVAAMHALEVFADIRDSTSHRPVELFDWLLRHSLNDGGMPFGLPHTDTAGSAPHWVNVNTAVSSLQMTTQLAAQAHRLARHRGDLDEHPWLRTATNYCMHRIASLEAALDPYELMFVVRFLDAAADRDPRAADLLDRFRALVVDEGPTAVPRGAEGEALHLLDFTPYADAPSRARLAAGAVTADLDRLASLQQADGGWTVGFATFSPAAALEWRGYATLRSVSVLTGARL